MWFRLLVFIGLLLSIDIYAFQAFRLVAESWPVWSRNLLYAFYWSIPAIAIGAMLYYSTSEPSSWNRNVMTILRALLIIAYLSKMLVVGVLLIDDLRRLLLWGYGTLATDKLVDLGRSRFLAQLGVILFSIPIATLTYGILRNPYRYRVYRETVEIDQLPAALHGLKIVQISDIHSGSFTQKEPIKEAIAMINKEKADLVFFTGDLVNSIAREMEPYIDIFDKIESRFGVFSVMGNHDYGDYVRWDSISDKQNNLQALKDTHQKMGWQLLLNEHKLLEINGEQVAIVGVENYSAHPRFPKYGDLKQALSGTHNARLKLLLSHDPSHWEDEVIDKFKDVDLTFSGHTHGFQFGIEIPGWFKWSPGQYVYKQWAGLYQTGKQFLYVNRGLGFLGYPGRVGILPEITALELKSSLS